MKSYLLDGWQAFKAGAVSSLPSLITIFIVAVIVAWVGALIARNIVARAIERGSYLDPQEQQQRIDTLQSIAVGSVKIVVAIIAVMTGLTELGVDIGPLLATAGVAGVALGFGAQYLIRDIITGFFVLIENQYSIGDLVCLDDTCGKVEAITLRMTQLRDQDGVVHHVPNGEISIASNLSKHYSQVNMDVGIDYEADIDEAIEVVNRVGKEMAEDAAWSEDIVEAPQFLRVEELGESAVVLTVLGKVTPGAQMKVAGELRKRLKYAFDAANIAMPFPQITVNYADEQSD